MFNNNYLSSAAFRHVAINMARTTISTGTKSEIIFGSPQLVRNIPMPQATSMPMGPLKLSTQPGTGSSIDDTTAIEILIMQYKFLPLFTKYLLKSH